jgi:fumarate reductase flavoprotein subunit
MTIVRAAASTFDEHVPVVIIGAGACGFTAALAARDAGAEALVLEQDERPYGSTGMSIGAVCGVNTAQQRARGIVDEPKQFVADVMAQTHGRADPALTMVIATESGPALDWLAARHDVPLVLDFEWRGLGHSQPRLHMPPGRTGEELLALLQAAAERAGAALLTRARVSALIADDDSRIRGVEISRPNGERERVGCDALVLATCGFGANRTMIAREIPEMSRARYFGHEGNRGDGIAWGLELGAAVADMTAYQGLGTLADPQSVIVPHTLLIDGGLLVNRNGQRFTHELENISGMCVPVLAQPDGLAWVIFDERRFQRSFEHSLELRQLHEAGAIKWADDVHALAAKLGMSTTALSEEVAASQQAASGGTNDRYNRSFRNIAPLAGRLGAIKVTGALFHTQGGLVVDRNAQVLRANGERLPNLFAGGGAARGISGPEVTGYLPAMGLCMAITLGRLAGRAAAVSRASPREVEDL